MKNHPEILDFVRNMIMEYHSPLGLSMTALASWCRNGKNEASDPMESKKVRKILYSGGLHVTMALIDRLRFVLPMMMNDPTKERRIRLLRRMIPIGRKILPFLSFRSPLKEIPKKYLSLLHQLGHNDVHCLTEEPYNGSLLLELGFKVDAIKYGFFLRDFFKKRRVEEMILIDPHTYEMFTEFYPKRVPEFDFKVTLIHDILVEHLDDLMELGLSRKLTVTYHDPCIYAKRLSNPVIEPPRKLISAIKDLKLIEAFNHGRRARCCGGPVELIFLELSEAVTRDRYEHLKQTGASAVITSCPICYISFRRVRRREDETEIIDLVDLLSRAKPD